MSRIDLARPEDLGDGTGRLPPPHLELEQPIPRRGVALREEQVGLVLRVDVVDAPAIAHDLDRLRQARRSAASRRRLREPIVPTAPGSDDEPARASSQPRVAHPRTHCSVAPIAPVACGRRTRARPRPAEYTPNDAVCAGIRQQRPQRQLRRRQRAAAGAADGDPLRPSGDAGRAGHRLRRRTRGPCARRSTASALDSVRGAAYDGTCEDLFFYIERLIRDACGDDVAGRLHTARSRNDIDMTMYRMRQREFVALLASRVARPARRAASISPTGTATRSSPRTRTRSRRSRARSPITCWPSSSSSSATRPGCAPRTIAPTRTRLAPARSPAPAFRSIATARARCSDSRGPTGNTYGSIATVDYLLESVSATAILLVGLGRVLQDLLLWCTMEFGYLRLSDGFVQSSSIMPQKRNPVALEHARAIGSKAVGQAQAIMTAVHNTPFGDIVDTEDDLQPLVASMFRDATRTVTLVAGGDARRRLRRRAAGVARRRGRHDADRAGRHAGARRRPAVPDGARHRGARC